jgi:hypothetical protein
MAKCADTMRNVNWNGNQPIIHLLRELIPRFFPAIPDHVRRSPRIHATGVGGYGGLGAHDEGRAADIYVNAGRENLKAIGDGLFQIFIHHGSELGVENVTWNRQTWDSARDLLGTPRPYTGLNRDGEERNEHTNHLHVSFTCRGSQNRPALLAVYLERLARQLGPRVNP